MGVLGENYTKEAFFTLGLINEYIYIYITGVKMETNKSDSFLEQHVNNNGSK